AAVAVGEGSVWAATEREGAVEINPRSNEEVRRVRVGNGARAIAVGAGAVWVANTLDGTVSRIAAETGLVDATIPVGGTPSGVAAG
ncbi:hypothetical protein MRO55_25645, partial [Escherichia coli]|uniref:YncE family protein n=1 Tax=Escherichia coli TaxID=562 RepID=UPI002113AD57